MAGGGAPGGLQAYLQNLVGGQGAVEVGVAVEDDDDEPPHMAIQPPPPPPPRRDGKYAGECVDMRESGEKRHACVERERNEREMVCVVRSLPPSPPESSETPPPPPRSESPRVIPPPIPEQMEVEEMEEHFHTSCSSSPSSIFSIPLDEVEDAQLISRRIGEVLRDGTATPSESLGGTAAVRQKERGEGEESKHGNKGPRAGGGDGKDGQGRDGGGSPENHDMNSEPNDSSGEEESGEDSRMLVESLNERLESVGRGLPLAGGAAGSSSASVRPGEESNVFLAALRKKLLTRLVESVSLVEEVGGMRAMSYLQLLMFLTTHLECCSDDGKVLTSVLLALLRRLGLDVQEELLTQHAVDGMVERSRRREVLLLYLRFFNILMSRRKVKGEDGKVSGWDVHGGTCM